MSKTTLNEIDKKEIDRLQKVLNKRQGKVHDAEAKLAAAKERAKNR